MRPTRFWTLFCGLFAVALAVFPRIGAAAPTPVPYDDRLDRDIARAQQFGGEVVIPDGCNLLTRPHVDPGISLRGADEGSVLVVPSTLPGPAITVRGNGSDNVRPHLSGFRLIGPGRMQLGKRTAGMDGLRFEGQATCDNLRVEQFDAGVNVASVGGHVFLRACTLTANYYNAEITVGGGNYLFDGCFLDGAGMASIAMPYSCGVEGMRVVSTHLGFAPYGVYQEATPAGQTPSRLFLCDCHFDEAWFEQCYQAVKSEWKGVDGGPRCEFRDNTFERVGWTFGAAFAPPGAPPVPQYQVEGDYMSDGFTYAPGNHPFGPGAGGKAFGFSRYNGVSGDAMMVPPGVTVNGVTPAQMP